MAVNPLYNYIQMTIADKVSTYISVDKWYNLYDLTPALLKVKERFKIIQINFCMVQYCCVCLDVTQIQVMWYYVSN